MPKDFDAPEGRSFSSGRRSIRLTDDVPNRLEDDQPFIRISRSGTTTDVLDRAISAPSSRRAIPPEEYFREDIEETEEVVAPQRRAKGARPMPKRLSEELEEMEMASIRSKQEKAAIELEEEKPAKKKATKRSKKAKAAEMEEAEQLPLNLKPAKKRTDSIVKQRQVLGTFFIMIAVLVTLAIVSYTPDDAPIAETKLSDIPAIFTGSNPEINARADMAHNWLRLLGAMMADFLINKTIGYAAIIYPIFFGWWSLALFRFTNKQRQRLTLATTFFLITAVLFSATIGTTQLIPILPHLAREWSGAVGQFLGLIFTRLIGAAGALIVYGTLFLVTLVFSIDLDIEKTFLRLKGYWDALVMTSRRKLIEFWDKREARKEEKERLREEEDALEAAEAAEEEAQEALRLANEELLEGAVESKPAPAKDDIVVRKPVVAKAAVAAIAAPEAAAATQVQANAPIKRVGPQTTKPVVRQQPVAESPATDIDPARDIVNDRQNSDQISKPLQQSTGIKVLRDVTMGATAAQAATGAAAASGVPTVAQGLLRQDFLKTRPMPKTAESAGGPIPRINRITADKLGEKAESLGRLSNGAISQSEPPAEVNIPQASQQPSEPVQASAPVQQEESASAAEQIDSINNIEEAEIISPLAPRAKAKPAVEVPPKKELAPIAIRHDGTTVKNEALPHSVMQEGLIIPEKMGLDEREQLGLYAEEPEKKRVVLPENPYNEILIRYKKPTVDLLTPSDPKDQVDADDEELAVKGRLLRDKLATFGVEIENITVTPGPVVTLYEFTPAEGVKVSRVENLTDDIALAMKARGIRIIAPIPGRGTIGVEIPNDVPKMVRIRSLFESASFRDTKMNLPLALGKTISGDVYIDDLNKMPHLLIAGATGAGKSVGVNGIIASLLYSKSPRDVKFVIVDPKKIELSLYKKLRKHFLIVSPEAGEDIVTTPAFAVLALKAVELEMEKRYDKLAKAAVRSLSDYNIKVAQGKLTSTQDEQHYHLPYIVVIIDELADLMITAGRDIEEPICRIAQMARAVGIHLILATQRPSVDVITGVIKANFPARVAFQVATRVDSRTILDSMGAEQLLGNGDMLYQPSGTPKPIRLQSPFISTEEVEAMIDAIAEQDADKMCYSRPWTLPSLKQKDGIRMSGMDDEDMRDELFEEAARIIVRHQQGSVSLLQRRLKVGYSRAARIVDELEQAGIVGAFDGSKARQVLCENDEELTLVLEGLR